VLEAFANNDNYHLYVCGPLHEEKEFQKVYGKELYETPNIHAIGWVDVTSPQFLEITKKCVGVVYPSCAEGGGGAALQCMHAGLIPIVTYEASVDVGDFGVILKRCSIEEIQHSIEMVSDLPREDLMSRSKKTWEYARAHHTRERFAEEYQKTIKKIISVYGNNKK
jgi:glycosyltransferase involved in cell wall biosynthesis